MNKIFRSIWNHARQSFVVVGETAKSHTKAKSSRAAIILSAGSFLLVSATAFASDLPTGGEVVGGSGSIATNGNTMTINQSTTKLAIDWQSFSIGQGNTVNFVQPSASSVALNRVLGADVSVIQGALNANGQVFLINPNGVLFTPTAQINVGGIVASTLNMSTADFMAGNYKFEGTSSNAIINQGNITAVGDGNGGGTIALIAAKITNTGSLTANKGNVLLGAGSKVTLDLGGPVKLQVTQGQIDALIESGGAIKADGGTILLTAKAAGDLAISVINHTGIIEAQTLSTGEKGQITLLGEGELITVNGKLDASAPNGGVGGRIVATGKRVLIDNAAHLTASGKNGGGEVLVGGSWQNSDSSVYQATGTIVAPNAKLEASAIDNGNGGTVVAWSDIHNPDSVTRAYGSFEAKGGVNGGDGGRIETSGYYLDVNQIQPTTDAPKGNKGLWLLDPVGITISNAANNFPGSEWNGTTSFYNTSNDTVINTSDLVNWVQANNLFVQTTGYLTVASPISYSSSNYLILMAAGSLSVNANITNSSNGYIRLITTEGYSGSISGSGNISTGGIFKVQGSLGNTTGSLSGTITASEIELMSIQYTFQNNTVTLSNNLITFAGTNPVAIINTASQLSTKTFSGSGLVRLNTNATIGGLSSIWKLDTSFYTATISGSGGSGVSSIEGSGAVVLTTSQNFNYWGSYSGSVTVNSGGSTSLSAETYTQSITVNSGGTLGTSGAVNLNGSLTLNGGTLNINSGSTLTLNRSSNLAINSAVNGQGNLNLNASSGNPVYTFNGDGSLQGTVTIGSGAIATLNHANAFGSTGAVTVNSGGTLNIGNGVTTNAGKSIYLNGTGVGGLGALRVDSGLGTFGGNITLGSDTTIGASSTGLTLGGTVNGAYALTANSSGTVTFNGVVGGSSPLTSITTNSGGTTVINNNISTTGAQNYGDYVSITGARTLIADNGQFNFTGSASSNNNNLILQGGWTNFSLSGNVATGSGWLHLKNPGTTGTLSSSGYLSGSGLLTQNFATVNLTGANNFATIAANNIGTAFNYVDADALTIGTVNSVSGLALGNAKINVATTSGDLTVANNVTTTDATTTAITLTAGRSMAAGNNAGGDIKFSGTPTISAGANGIVRLFSGKVDNVTFPTDGAYQIKYGANESTTFAPALEAGKKYIIYREIPYNFGTAILKVDTDGNVELVSSGGAYANQTYGDVLILSATISTGASGELLNGSSEVVWYLGNDPLLTNANANAKLNLSACAGLTSCTLEYTLDASTLNAGTYSNLKYVFSVSNTGATYDSLTLDPKALTLNNFTAVNKVYDGNVTAGFSADIVGRVGDDTLNLTATFADKNVGASKTVTAAISNGNYTLSPTTALADINRLNSVAWTGGTTGNWFDPANWAAGAVPDVANVANVVIPDGVNVSFDSAGTVVAPAQTGAVSVDSISMPNGETSAALSLVGGQLNVASSLNLGSFIQSGGALVNNGIFEVASFSQSAGTFNGSGSLTVSNSFSQTSDGLLSPLGAVNITQASGSLTWMNISTGGDLTLSSLANAIAFGATTVGGDLSASTHAGVTQTQAISVTGTSTFIADAEANQDAILNHTSNDFGGAVSFSGLNAGGWRNISLADANGIELGNVTATGTLGVSAEDDISQTSSSVIATTGATTLTSINGNIVLDGLNNTFTGPVSATGVDITLVAVNALDVTLTATGNSMLTAGGDLKISGETNNLSTITTNGGNTTFGATTIAGNLDVISAGTVTQTGALGITGTATLESPSKIDLSNPSNTFGGTIKADSPNSTLAGAGAPSVGPLVGAISGAQQIALLPNWSPLLTIFTSDSSDVNLASLAATRPSISVTGFKVVEVDLENIDRNADGTARSDEVDRAVGALIRTAMNDKTVGSPVFLVLDKGIKMPEDDDDDNVRRKVNSK
ncbi:MAG: filamentous hemagglutinin N-terminal domain-containing protein [Methylotenera sp.]|nr:filamentous hemagglutinin N-terminal domain-containing protein [Methylotenera sp.]